MLKELDVSTKLNILDCRIHILRTRGEIMNHGLINKLERKKRKIMREAHIPIPAVSVSPSDAVDF